MADVSAEIMEKNNLKAEDISWLVPHQANFALLMPRHVVWVFGKEKVMVNIERYGNTTGATIPCVFGSWKKLEERGQPYSCCVRGGFTWGSIWIKWAYDS